MRRRAFLAGVTGLFAGCGGFAAGRGSDDPADRETVTPAPVPTEESTPGVGRRRFATEGCPTIDHRTHQTVCSHTQPSDASLRLTPDRAVARLDGGRLLTPMRFTLQWTASGALSVFADSWHLLRKRGDEWTSVATAAGRDPVRRLESGERFYWVLDTVEHYSTDRIESVVADLSPGRYALGVQTVGDASSLYSECLAMFDVVSNG
ncbi:MULTISPECIES: hypothetical protein [Haloarcula]|uniref:hypothetical protein n=1 Tax=Haloarcula TaxID=2237 RepID=UPI0023ED291D|nr:hypothetical protein [Halomicroarcula sp. XH51]